MVGTWLVRDQSGAELGTTTLTLAAGQCVIEERFVGKNGYSLISLLYFDRFIGTWFRTQMDNATNAIRVGGRLSGTDLQLNGVVPTRGTTGTPVRLRWDLSDVTQPIPRWEALRGGTWNSLATLFWTRLS